MPRLTKKLVPLMARMLGRAQPPAAERYWRLALADDGAAELLIYGVIGQMAWSDEPSLEALTLVREIEQITASTIRLRINSPGGLVADATAIFNALRRHGAHIETYNDAEASSAGSFLFMAGDTRVMAGNALLMIHSAWAFVGGNPKQLRKHAETLDRQNAALVPAYARSGMDTADVEALLADGENHWFTADEAEAAGFATAVDEPLAAAAHHDFATHKPPERLLQARPEPRQPAAAKPPAPDNPAAVPAHRESPEGAPPMNWIALALALALAVDETAGQDAAKTAVLKHLKLADDATDEQVTQAMARREQPAPAAQAARSGDLDAAVARALDTESKRRADISKMFGRYAGRNLPQLRDLEARCLNDRTTTPEAAGMQLLTLLGDQAAPIAGGHVQMGEDDADKRVAGMTQGLLARMGVRGEDYDPQNPWRGARLVDLGRDSLQRQGVNVAGMMPNEIAEQVLRAQAAQTTSDFTNVLSNTMHRLVLAGFMEVPVTWNRVCRQGDVSDFRDWERHVPGLIGNYQSVNERGEYRNKNLPDTEKSAIRAARTGLIVAVTVETMVNDDIGYIQSQATDIGRAGSRTIDADFYTLLNSNPVVKGKPLFHADHNNLAASGAAPTVDLIDAAAVAMSQQRAPAAAGEDEGQLLDISPAIILANRKRQGDLRVLIGAEYDPDASNKLQKPNKVRNLVEDIVTSPRAAAAPWYLFASPNVAPVFEVVFLNGQREPRVVMEENFRSSGLSWKAELPFGVGPIDYRGAYKNPGA